MVCVCVLCVWRDQNIRLDLKMVNAFLSIECLRLAKVKLTDNMARSMQQNAGVILRTLGDKFGCRV
jgi:hypothetical protein